MKLINPNKYIKKLVEFKTFESFVHQLNEDCTQRKSAISTAVSQLKARYGDTTDKFLKSVQGNVDEVKDYLVEILTPYMDRIEAQEKLQNSRFGFDFDGLLFGLASWVLVELELDRMKKKDKKENE